MYKIYDLEVILFASTTQEKYINRFKNFVKYGLVNCHKSNIIVSVVLDHRDNELLLGELPKNFKIKKVETKYWDQKMSLYLTSKEIEDARWYIRLDDDSATNVDMLVETLDEKFFWQDPLYLTAERLFDIHMKYRDILIEMGYGRWFNNWYENPRNANPQDRNDYYRFSHEWECALFSNTAIQKIQNSDECKRFTRILKETVHEICLADHITGILARLCKLHPIEMDFVTSQCYLENFSGVNTAGKYHHIHYIGPDTNSNGYTWSDYVNLIEQKLDNYSKLETWEPLVFENRYNLNSDKENIAFVFPITHEFIPRLEKCIESLKKIYGDNLNIIIANYDDRRCLRETLSYDILQNYAASKGYSFIRVGTQNFWCESIFQIQISKILYDKGFSEVYLIHSDILIVRDFVSRYREKMIDNWSFICPFISYKSYHEYIDRYSGSMWGDGRLHMSIIIYNKKFINKYAEKYTVKEFWEKIFKNSVAHSDLEHFDLGRLIYEYKPNVFDYNDQICIDLLNMWNWEFLSAASNEELVNYLRTDKKVCFLHASYTLDRFAEIKDVL